MSADETPMEADDQSVRPVWIMLGCVLVAGGLGAEIILFGLDVLEFWPLAFHGPFWLWAATTLALATATRFAAWLLLFGWVVMFIWALLVALVTGLDALLIPQALLFSMVPAVAFLGQEPSRRARAP